MQLENLAKIQFIQELRKEDEKEEEKTAHCVTLNGEADG